MDLIQSSAMWIWLAHTFFFFFFFFFFCRVPCFSCYPLLIVMYWSHNKWLIGSHFQSNCGDAFETRLNVYVEYRDYISNCVAPIIEPKQKTKTTIKKNKQTKEVVALAAGIWYSRYVTIYRHYLWYKCTPYVSQAISS